MSLRFRYSDPRGIDEPATMVTLGSNIRWGEGGFALSAELAQAAISGVGVDDPGGIYDLVGLRAFEVAETSAPSNNQIIGRFAIGDQTIGRNEDRALITGADRYWDLDLADYNWHAGKRVLVDADSNRPEETAGDRLRWLINDAAHINLNDYGHVTYPTRQLDAVDFRLQRPMDVLADCAVEDGYLFWVDYNEAHGKPELFFIDPDSDTYQASIQVSNVLDDVVSDTIFAPYVDAKLVRTPRAIAFGVALPYQNGFVYVRKDSTGQQFAKQDQVAPMKNVKKAARARRIANRFLNQSDEQSERLSFALKVPWAQVNDVRHGQLMNVKFSHLPGYADWTGVRVLRKYVSQEPEGGDDHAMIQIEAVPTDALATQPQVAPTVKWVYFETSSVPTLGEFSVQASDDGAAWSTVVTGAQLLAGTVDPPGVSPQTVVGLVAVSDADWRHRHWRLRFETEHLGGFFAFRNLISLRLLSDGSYSGVCRLGTTTQGDVNWWGATSGSCGGSGQSPCWTGDVAYSAVLTGASNLWGGTSGSTCSTSDRGTTLTAGQGCGYGIKSQVMGATTVTATWTYDIGYE